MRRDEQEMDPVDRRPPPHGQLSYLQMPARDVAVSAGFYAEVFGWETEPPASGFEAPGLIGQWVREREPAPEAGLLPWIQVDDLEAALARVRAAGGEVLSPPVPDGPVRWLATARDPGGNMLGLVEARHGTAAAGHSEDGLA
jgi:uncharacterized protein